MKKESFWDKAATRSVLASLVAILTGMVAGGLIILIVGLTNPTLGIKGAWEGIRLGVAGLFSTGRGSAGARERASQREAAAGGSGAVTAPGAGGRPGAGGPPAGGRPGAPRN